MGIFDFFKVNQFKKEIEELKQENTKSKKQLEDLGAYDYFQIKEMIASLHSEYEKKKADEELFFAKSII